MNTVGFGSKEEFRADVGRADKGRTFVRVVHLPSGKERVRVGIQGGGVDETIDSLISEIQTELGLPARDSGLADESKRLD